MNSVSETLMFLEYGIVVKQEVLKKSIDFFEIANQYKCLTTLKQLGLNIPKETYSVFDIVGIQCLIEDAIKLQIPEETDNLYDRFGRYKSKFLEERGITKEQLDNVYKMMNKILEILNVCKIIDIYNFLDEDIREILCRFKIYIEKREYSEIIYKKFSDMLIEYYSEGKLNEKLKEINVTQNEYNAVLASFNIIDEVYGF